MTTTASVVNPTPEVSRRKLYQDKEPAAGLTNTAEVLQSASTTDITNNTSGVTPPNSVTVTTEDFDLLQQLKQERRGYVMKDKIKLHSKVMSSRRITVALRRSDLKVIAPDQDVVAYIEICNLKAVAGEKAEATEDEMVAYLLMFDAGNDQPTLEQIKAAIK